MQKHLTLLSLFLGITSLFVNAQDINFNKNWLFYNDVAQGAENPSFNDSHWRQVDLPHDWAIEGPFDEKYNARCGGLPFHGTGWYRKNFHLSAQDKGKIISIEFEGAMKSSTVWINGVKLGYRPYGYIGFEYDMTKYLKFDGSENVVAVRLTPEDLSTRWYPGAGLYRSVWLKKNAPVHVAQWGTFITTPKVTNKLAVVQNETTINNKSSQTEKVTVKQEYFSPNGTKVASTAEEVEIAANSEYVSGTWVNIENPERWEMNSPNLYTAKTSIIKKEEVIDSYETRFGIRTIKYSADGFYLNDKQVKFKGVCLHHDNGALGSAVYKRADERKLQIMRSMGVNAIRTSHNPPSRELLEICDEMGMLVLNEAFDGWSTQKTDNGYHLVFNDWAETDLKDFIRRDRNHPSVIMWSLGNEIGEQKDAKYGWRTAKMMNDWAKEMDKTRPTTVGLNNYPRPFDSNFAQQLDIVGMNYKPNFYKEVKENNPDLPIYGSENSSCTSSRGVYHLPIEKYNTHESKHVTSYDIIGPPWAYPPDIEFHFLEENPNIMGQFVWTGFDYLGEPTPYGGKDNSTNGYWNGDWPVHSSYFGIVDLCGFPKDRFYLYQSEWSSEPMVHLLPHWNWEGMEGKEIPVYCYTNCEEAELFLNGKSLGKRIKGKDKTEILIDFSNYEHKTFQSKYRLSWNVPYQAGELKVIGFKDGTAIREETVTTAGKPAQIELSADKTELVADGRDLAYVTVRILDKNGNFCPLADNQVLFNVVGDGKLIGVDNGNQASLEPFQAKQRKAFNGMCLAILNSSETAGEFKLNATSKGLRSAVVVLKTNKTE